MARFAVMLLLLMGSHLLLSCAPAFPLSRVTRLEVAPVRSDGSGPVVIDGPELRGILDTAVCHDGNVLWKGGIPAAVILDDGRRRKIDGLSFYGGFIRLSRKQWCELGPARGTSKFFSIEPEDSSSSSHFLAEASLMAAAARATRVPARARRTWG
jgi:hypothetical protein